MKTPAQTIIANLKPGLAKIAPKVTSFLGGSKSDSSSAKSSRTKGAEAITTPSHAGASASSCCSKPPSATGKGVCMPALTTITAKVDVGWGNKLYIRGEGGDLKWDSGKLLENKGSAEWLFAFRDLQKPVRFKLLINDQTWCQGEDIIAYPGKALVCRPLF